MREKKVEKSRSEMLPGSAALLCTVASAKSIPIMSYFRRDYTGADLGYDSVPLFFSKHVECLRISIYVILHHELFNLLGIAPWHSFKAALFCRFELSPNCCPVMDSC